MLINHIATHHNLLVYFIDYYISVTGIMVDVSGVVVVIISFGILLCSYLFGVLGGAGRMS